MHWQYEQLVERTVRQWVAAEVPDAVEGWEKDAEYVITATERPERWWTVTLSVPVSSGTMHVEVVVGGEGVGNGPSATVVGARRPGRGRLQDRMFLYERNRGWYENVTEPEPTKPALRMV